MYTNACPIKIITVRNERKTAHFHRRVLSHSFSAIFKYDPDGSFNLIPIISTRTRQILRWNWKKKKDCHAKAIIIPLLINTDFFLKLIPQCKLYHFHTFFFIRTTAAALALALTQFHSHTHRRNCVHEPWYYIDVSFNRIARKIPRNRRARGVHQV